MGRIIAAVVVGFVLWSAIWLVLGMVVTKVAPEAAPVEGQRLESTGILLLFIAIAVVISALSGFVAVKIAPASANKAGWILAVVLLIFGVIVEVSGWDTTPAWYHVVFLVLLVPCVLGGARLGTPGQTGAIARG
jgi:uncharacterized membrane protein